MVHSSCYTLYIHRAYLLFLLLLLKIEFSWQIFEKYLNTQFNENSSSVSLLFLAGRQTDGHDEAKSRFSQFYEERLKKNLWAMNGKMFGLFWLEV